MKKLLIILGILVTILLIIVSLFILLRWDGGYSDERALTEDFNTEIQAGVIMGSLSYPSEYMPNLETCAVNIQTDESYCTYQMIQGPNFTYGYGYQIQAPPGSYQVYSKINDEYEPYKAYYSKFITCGGEYTCTDHTPITIQVIAGDTIRNIDTGDWYANY
jgi:hypothetical protein